MSTLMESIPVMKNSIVTEVPVGARAVLDCSSNDYDHNFMFWLLNKTKVIGPGNSDFDERKYKYEVLSGKLHIDNVSPAESGLYTCVSQKLGKGSRFSVGEVEMIVKGTSSVIDVVQLVAIVVSIIIIISCAVIYYRLRKEWNKYDGRTVVPVDEPDEEEGDEIYNRTTTTLPQPMPGPSRNQSSEHLLYGIDNQGLDTDFNSVFENIQIKSPASLI